MCTDAEHKPQMYAKSSDICSSLAADPEDRKMSVIVEFVKRALINRPYSQLSLDSGDQRRALKESSRKSLECSCEGSFSSRNLVMESDDANILFPSTLLRFHQSSRPIDTNNQAAGDFRIKSSAVASLLDPVVGSALLQLVAFILHTLAFALPKPRLHD